MKGFTAPTNSEVALGMSVMTTVSPPADIFHNETTSPVFPLETQTAMNHNTDVWLISLQSSKMY